MPKTGESGWKRRNRSSTAAERPNYYEGQKVSSELSRSQQESGIESSVKTPVIEGLGALQRYTTKIRAERHNELYPPGARTDVSPDQSRQDIDDYKEHAASAAKIGLRPMEFGAFVKSRSKGK